jgi:hypothetical protein
MEMKTLTLAYALCGFVLQAQQPTPAFQFRALTASGAKIGHYVLSSDTDIDSIAINGNGDLVLAVSHLRLADSIGSAVLTPQRVVATSFDHIGTKILVDIFAPSLVIDEQGHAVFEASYKEGEGTHLGVFKEKEFQFVVNGPGAADDFTLSTDGRIVPKTGITPEAVPARSATGPQQARGGPGRALQQMRINPALLRQLNTLSPLMVPPDILSQVTKGQQQPNTPQPAKPATPAPKAVTQAAKPAAACALPLYPFPVEWAVSSEMKGPITSSVFDGPNAKQRAYESPFFGHMGSPFRNVYYTPDCVAQMIVIGDSVVHGKVELWGPNGLITNTQPDGFLQLPGYTGKVPPGALSRRDVMLSINRHGQMAMVVTLDPEGFAVLLATPIPGR